MSAALDIAVQEFLAEAEETLERVTLGLSSLERGREDTETVHSLYRDMHSLKGSAQLFGCQRIGRLAHAMEAALEPVREGLIQLDARSVDTLYAGIDAVRRHVKALRDSGAELPTDEDLTTVIPKLVQLTTNAIAGTSTVTRDDPFAVTRQGTAPSSRASLPAGAGSVAAVKAAVASPVVRPSGEPPASSQEAAAKVPARSGDERARAKSGASPADERSGAPVEASAGESIRVSVGLLDKLMNLVGELVLIRNQVVQVNNAQTSESEFLNLSQRLSVVTTELQNEVMKTRMQPIGTVVTKFHRVVRDMARDLGKIVELKLEGTETELDKALIEAIKDPLTHLVRNAVDHGLEMPADRRAAGKNDGGCLTLRSYHEGGQVIVEIQDNGRGLSRQRIATKAIERGLAAAEVVERMSDREVHQLIFAPGFSTAEQVSNFSGRGVGMDVVRTNIERIGGVVDLTSIEGEGTTVRLKIPLTLAIIPALIIRSESERFAIPQVKLVELLRAEHGADGVPRGIEMLQGKPVYRLRGDLLPLVSLNETLDLAATAAGGGDATNIVVLNADHGYFGLVVDEIVDSTDIVVKPLTSFLKALNVYSGATVLGDGSVVLTLDVIGLANRVALFDERSAGEARRHGTDASNKVSADMTEYLMIDVGASSRYAMPLGLVKRLEEFKAADIQISGGQRVIRYRDSILPIVSVPHHLGIRQDYDPAQPAAETVPVVVVERGDRQFGLEVRKVLDVLAADSVVDMAISDRPGIFGSMIRDNEIIVVADAAAIIDLYLGKPANTVAGQGAPAGAVRSARAKHHILLVEDNAFFRRHVERLLTENGYRVTSAFDGKSGLDRLLAGQETFALVLSDIEMPVMNGLELARQIRERPQFAKLPLVALTTRFRQADQEAGMRAGFVQYLEKLNGNQLLVVLDAVLGVGGGG